MSGADGQAGCGANTDCDDANVCTHNVCANTVCTFPPVNDGPVCATGFCKAGACVAPPTLPSGAVVITEIHFNPAKTTDANGEWIEVFNPTASPVSLKGVVLADKSTTHTITTAYTVPPQGYGLLGINGDPNVNGGVTLSVVYSKIALSNASSGGRIALLNADKSVIDEVVYQTTTGLNGWPGDVAGRSYQLSPESPNLANNHEGKRWCWGRETFGAGDRGSPGKPNGSCKASWCRLQWPLSATIKVGDKSTSYARVYFKGVTDQSDKTDVDPDLQTWAGYGPDGSKSPELAGWQWVKGAPNAGYSATVAKEPNNDEYQATISPAAAGTYDTAWRVSWRGSQDFVYCDTKVGLGSDGSEDGYGAASAGELKVTQ